MSPRASFPTRNALLAVVDYLAQPVLLLALTPLLLRRLGATGFSLYLLATTLVAASTLFSSGFGDAAIRFRHRLSEAGSHLLPRDASADRLFRTVVTLNLLMGLVLGGALAACAPAATHLLRGLDAREAGACIACLRVGSLLLGVRCVEMAVLACLRALERYDAAVPLSVAGKVLTLAATGALAMRGAGPRTLLLSAATIGAVFLCVELFVLYRLTPLRTLAPLIDVQLVRQMGGFGAASWVQGIIGILTQQADRLVVGATLGASSFAVYSICTQLAMPVHSVTSAGLQSLFPRLGRLLASGDTAAYRATLHRALWINVCVVVCLTVPLMVWSSQVLHRWLGVALPHDAAPALRWATLAAGLLALNVTAYWALLAEGRIQRVVALNAAGAALMIVGLFVLTPRFGLAGAAMARTLFGPVTWWSYLWLRRPSPEAILPRTAQVEAA